jgi:hypothetical protein
MAGGDHVARCEGSGDLVDLAWVPDDKGYPGAAVCLHCSGGIQVRKGSAKLYTLEDGREVWAGILKVHTFPKAWKDADEHLEKHESPPIECSEPDCPETIPNHMWGKVKSNWFFQKDGKQYCPKHTPAWVAGWRARKAKRK